MSEQSLSIAQKNSLLETLIMGLASRIKPDYLLLWNRLQTSRACSWPSLQHLKHDTASKMSWKHGVLWAIGAVGSREQRQRKMCQSLLRCNHTVKNENLIIAFKEVADSLFMLISLKTFGVKVKQSILYDNLVCLPLFSVNQPEPLQ